MNFKKVVVDRNEVPLGNNVKVLFGPSKSLGEVLEKANELLRKKKESQDEPMTRYQNHLRTFLIENEEPLRYATQYVKERYYFDGLLDDFKTNDILDILEKTVTLEQNSWTEENIQIVSDYEDA